MSYLKKTFLLICSAFVQINFCMASDEDTEKKTALEKTTPLQADKELINLPMKEIKKYEELGDFIDCVVAYKVPSFYFGANCGPFEGLNYGYIQDVIKKYFGGKGYEMQALIRPDGLNRVRALNNYELELEGPIFLRKLVYKEIKNILTLIYLKKCNFDYHFSIEDYINSVFLRQLNDPELIGRKQLVCDNSPIIRCFLIGIKDPSSPFSKLPKDIYMIIIKFVIDDEVKNYKVTELKFITTAENSKLIIN